MKMPNGYGTVTKLSGNRRRPYAVRVPVRDKKGRVRQKYLDYFRTSQEAMEALMDYRKKRAAQTAVEPENLGVTLQEVYDAWSARKYARAGAASVVSYRASWKRVSALASTPIRKIGVDALQAVLDNDKALGLSKSSIANDHLLIKSLFAFAMERDMIVKDYSQFIDIPRVQPKYEEGILTEQQIAHVAQLAAQGFPWADVVLILCYTGYRISELLTRTPADYDAQEDVLRGGMKTQAGKNKIIPIHPKIKPYLMKRLAKNGQTIICREDGTSLTASSFRISCFEPVAKTIGQPVATPHWCRHTFASRLHAAGVNELDIKRLMGHANSNQTEHYTHAAIETLRAAILRLV